MARKLKGVRMSINFPSTYLSSQHENKFEIKIAPYLSQVLSFDLHEGRNWVLRRKVLRHHQDQVPWWRDKMKISRNWNEERRQTSDHHKWFQRNDAKTTVSTFAAQRNQWNQSISNPPSLSLSHIFKYAFLLIGTLLTELTRALLPNPHFLSLKYCNMHFYSLARY